MADHFNQARVEPGTKGTSLGRGFGLGATAVGAEDKEDCEVTKFCRLWNWNCEDWDCEDWNCEDWDCEDCELDDERSCLMRYRCISEKLDRDR